MEICSPFGKLCDQLQLVGLVLEELPRLLPRDLRAREGVVAAHDGAHPLLDVRQVLRAQRPRKLEVVVEAVVDGGADGELRLGELLQHRLRHDVGEGVPHGQERRLPFVFHHIDPPDDKAPFGCFVHVLCAATRRACKDEKPPGAFRGSTLIRPSKRGAAEARSLLFTGSDRRCLLTRTRVVFPAAAREWFSAVRGRSPLTPAGGVPAMRARGVLSLCPELPPTRLRRSLWVKYRDKPRSVSRRRALAQRLTSFRKGVYIFGLMKRIDIYTIDIGGGHIAPAMALKEQFDIQGHKDLDVHVVNLGIALGASFLRYLYKFYWNNALRYPPLINAFYRGVDNPFMVKLFDKIFGITVLPKFVRYLEREKPDLVVSTYFTFTHYLELLKRAEQLDAISVVLNPEPFDSHYLWFSPAFDWSMVFSRKSHDEIVEKGILASRVKTFHFPIKPSFSRRTESKTVLRRRLGLSQKPFTALFFFGAEGVGPVSQVPQRAHRKAPAAPGGGHLRQERTVEDGDGGTGGRAGRPPGHRGQRLRHQHRGIHLGRRHRGGEVGSQPGLRDASPAEADHHLQLPGQ